MTSYGFNPALSATERIALERENFAVLMTSQALLGLIDPNMTAVAIRLSADTLHVRFGVRSQTDAMTETAEDLATDLNAFYAHLADAPRIECEIVVAAPELDWYRSPWRMIFAAKPPDAARRRQAS
jgi:hypothetical protein